MMKVTIAPGTGRFSASVTRTVGFSAVCSPAIPVSPTFPLRTMFAGGPAFGAVLSLQESANEVTATARIADRFMGRRRSLRATGEYLPEHCHNAHQRASLVRSATECAGPRRRSAPQKATSILQRPWKQERCSPQLLRLFALAIRRSES